MKESPGLTWEEAKAKDPLKFHVQQMRGGEAREPFGREFHRHPRPPAWLMDMDAADFLRWLEQAGQHRTGGTMKQALAHWIFSHLSGNNDEYCTPPGSECWFRFGELDEGQPMYTATTYNNDGHEIWLCHTEGGRWWGFYPAPAARRLAWHILWDWWAVSTWFGLKRRIWYWSLSQQRNAQEPAR